jgi:ferrochelatase
VPDPPSDLGGGPAPGTGVLLVNLGTPDAPTPEAVRRYLAEFLWDPRVVDVFRPLWWLILHGIVLRTRPARSAALYRKVWTEAGSPLLVIGRRQAAALQRALTERAGAPVPVVLGMRYGRPSIRDGLAELGRAGCHRAVVLPLFPQYSISTTASVEDVLTRLRRALPDAPRAELVPGYAEDPGYVAALAASVREAWEEGGEPDRLLMSFHGTPARYRDAKGDPYEFQCRATAGLLAEALDLAPERWAIAFQSRFGKEPWLQPYTDETLKAWAAEGLGTVDVICPGFPADCLETLEEIAVTNAEMYREAGGGELRYIPALNDRPGHVEALADLLAPSLGV